MVELAELRAHEGLPLGHRPQHLGQVAGGVRPPAHADEEHPPRVSTSPGEAAPGLAEAGEGALGETDRLEVAPHEHEDLLGPFEDGLGGGIRLEAPQVDDEVTRAACRFAEPLPHRDGPGSGETTAYLLVNSEVAAVNISVVAATAPVSLVLVP